MTINVVILKLFMKAVLLDKLAMHYGTHFIQQKRKQLGIYISDEARLLYFYYFKS